MADAVMRITTARAAVSLDKLPALAQELVQIAGYDDAMAVLRACGGTRVCFGRSGADTAWLVEIVGVAKADVICSHMSRITVDLPKYDSIERQIKHARAVELDASGSPANDIARELGYSRRNVMLILAAASAAEPQRRDEGCANGLPPDERQMDMFGSGGQPAAEAHDPFGLRRGAAHNPATQGDCAP